MRRAQPRLWLMTDERLGEQLWPALARLPRGSGVVFRHYSLPPAERRALFARVAAVARRRGLVLVAAGADRLGRGAAGRHNPRHPRAGLVTRSVHTRADAIAAARRGELAFVSPVFATRSHPGARALGPRRAALLIRGLRLRAIALGGINERSFRRLRGLGFTGWAAIEAWAEPSPSPRP